MQRASCSLVSLVVACVAAAPTQQAFAAAAGGLQQPAVISVIKDSTAVKDSAQPTTPVVATDIAKLATPAPAQQVKKSSYTIAVRRVHKRGREAALGGVHKTTTAQLCFSEYVYTMLMDSVSLTQETVTSYVDEGGRAVTVTTLALFLALSLLLLLVGAYLVHTTVVVLVINSVFMILLYLFNWMDQSSGEEWVRCLLPFILSLVFAVITGALTMYFIHKIEGLVFFIAGAAGGAMGMYVLRDVILSANPDLADAPAFNYYWLGVAAVSILCAVLAGCLKSTILISVTALVGAYGVASTTVGLVPSAGGGYPATWVFWLLFFLSLAVGLGVQCGMDRRQKEKEGK